MTTEQTTPLSIEEASAQLRELDQLLYRHKITGIAYRNKKERLLARISKPADGPTHRYTTRRQVNALNPPQRKTFATTDQRQAQPILTRVPPPQQMRDEMRDFIVYSTDDDASEEIEYSTHDIGGEEEEEEHTIDIGMVPVQSAAKNTNTDEQHAVIYTDMARREHEEHFKSVTVQFKRSPPVYAHGDASSQQRQPTGGLVTNYSPMFPPKLAKTVYIDFGTNKF